MSQAKPSSNRGGVIIGVIVIVLLIIILIVVLKILNPEPDSGPGAVDPSTPSTGIVVFQSYYIEPERINAGNCATVSWVVENADNIQLLRDGSVVVNNCRASDSYRDCPKDPSVYKYRLEASNSENANWIELQLIVDE
jgi:hypothetical protein